MKRFIIFLIVILLLPAKIFAQELDTLRAQLKREPNESEKPAIMANIAFHIINTNPDSAIMLAKQAMQFALQVKNDNGFGASCNAIGWAFYRLGKSDSAIIYLEKARNIYHTINRTKGEGRSMINLGVIYEAQKNHEKGLDYTLRGEKLFESIKDDTDRAYADRELGIIYRELGQPGLAKAYLLSALQTFKALNQQNYYSDALSSIGQLYLNAKLYDSALFYYRQSLLMCNGQRSINAAYAWDNVADVFFKLSEQRAFHPYIDSALDFYSQSHDIFKGLNSPADVAYEDIKVGKCWNALGKYLPAIDRLTSSLNYFKKDNEINYAFDAAQELSNAYHNQGNYPLALKYLQESGAYKDSLDAASNKEQMANMFARYEADKKDKTILLLNTQEKLSQQDLSRQHIITLFTLSLILLGFFLVFILWNRNRIKQQLKEVEMRNQLSSDLHDDIGSSLSSILLLSNMAAQKGEDERINKNLLEKINNNAKEVIERMSDIVWSMNPKYDEGESLRERIQNYIAGLKEVTTVNICGNIDTKIDQYHFTMELRKNIFLIIKEAMNNALKYANSTHLQLDFTAEEKYFLLMVKDDGKGFDKAGTAAGYGFETMINRAKASDGMCDIISTPGGGTLIKAIIPIPNIR